MIEFWFIAAALAVSHLAALGAGGYLHYRFGAKTVRAAAAVADAFKK
jgi:hypothetical protein